MGIGFNMKKKIGILIFTYKKKDRSVNKKGKGWDNVSYYGFNYIISEINKRKYDIKYISYKDINNVDFVLISITSHFDLYNIINELSRLKIKSKIIVGGAGLLNFGLLRDYIDIAVLGRAEGQINDILDGKEFNNVWRKKNDYNIKMKYDIRKAEKLINIKDIKEKSIGCKRKCYFCQYSWKNRFYTEDKQQNYDSGYSEYEDTIENINWNKRAAYLVSAIDGLTEESRFIVNKKITNNIITNKLKEIYNDYGTKKKFALKLYSIVAYPFESTHDLTELLYCIKQADKISNKKLHIFLCFTHFVPMPLTPMESEPVNLMDARKLIGYGKIYTGKSINATILPFTTSNLSALEETILFRANNKHLSLIKNILLNSKYKKLKNWKKVEVIKKYFPKELYKFNKHPVPYVNYTYDINGAKRKYYSLIE